jgi:anti-sigma regulatory factor (Ser/Thr protein kinase)
MDVSKYSFKLKSDLSELKTLCRHLSYFGQVNGLSENLISEINICLDELLTNIILYGFKDDLEHTISFRLNLSGNALEIHMQDNGIPFNPLSQKDPDLPADIDHAEIGGLGLHIVKKLMDDIRYERKSGKNRLTLKKVIPSTSHLFKNKKPDSLPSNYYA